MDSAFDAVSDALTEPEPRSYEATEESWLTRKQLQCMLTVSDSEMTRIWVAVCRSNPPTTCVPETPVVKFQCTIADYLRYDDSLLIPDFARF